jgi:uncharacterized protein
MERPGFNDVHHDWRVGKGTGMKLLFTTTLLLALTVGCPDGSAENRPVVSDPFVQTYASAIPLAAYPFELEQIRLLDGPFKAALDLNQRYVESLDPDSLLWNFRVNAGRPAPGAPLAGWEDPNCPIRGHFTGHYLSALGLMYASTGDRSLKTRADHLVAELARCQQALGGEYLSAFPENVFDRMEAEEPVWASYYVIHKIMAGLLDQYRYCRNPQALEMVERMVSYFKTRTDRISAYQMDRALEQAGHWWKYGHEIGGIGEPIWTLYHLTRAPDARILASRLEKAVPTGQLALRHDAMSHRHGNELLTEMFGIARRYEVTGDPVYRDITSFFWEQIAYTRSYATGGSTLREDWPEPNHLAHTLGYRNEECCVTYGMLRLARQLFSWTGEPQYADFYERALFNGILGTQENQEGRLMYYVPLGTGFQRAMLSHSGHFYCCIGTGMESHSKLGDSIYFHDDAGIYVNLFVASTVDWREKGIRLEQLTGFPQKPGTSIIVHLDKPVSFALNIRIPYWATNGVKVKINGREVSVQTRPRSYLRLNRLWENGDRIEVSMPMALHRHPMPDNPELMAIMYGPLVLAGITAPDTGGPFIVPPGKDFPDSDRQPNHDFFLADPDHLDTWLKPVPDRPLAFRTTGQAHDITFIPFCQIKGERYGLYWVVTTENSPYHKRLSAEARSRAVQIADPNAYAAERDVRRVDGVIAADENSEKQHGFAENRTMLNGPVEGGVRGRCVKPGDMGWWTYELKVRPDMPMLLACTYWGSEADWIVEISVDGKFLAEQLIAADRPGAFFDVEYPLPEDMTSGKDRITVEFRNRHPNGNGTVFRCATLRPTAPIPLKRQ